MGIGKGSFRRAVFGAFVGALLLALSVPGIALAATASFTSKTPAPGSSSTNAKPTISVTVYDVRGIRYMSNILLSLDGHRVTPTVRFAAGYGFRKLTMSYAVPSNLSLSSHTVKVYVKDRSGQASRTSWSFKVTTSDTTAPQTTSIAVAGGVYLLFPTDEVGGSGVAHTYWKLDGGTQFVGTAAFTAALGFHSLEFWSVDNAGNVETHHTVTFTLVANDLLYTWHQSDTVFCTQPDCHFASLTVEHAQHSVDFTCARCHSSTDAAVVAAIKAGSDDCMACHTNFTHIGTTDHHATVVPPTAAINCIQTGCHAGNLAAIHGPGKGCADCHENAAHAATNDCTVCHGTSGPHAAGHVAISGVVGTWAHNLGDPSCTASTCHGSDLMAPHITTANPTACGTCHSAVAGSKYYAATIIAVTTSDATCVDCHNPAHAAGTNHNILPTCNCHGDGTPDNDASAIHMSQETTVAGVVITGCAICHANADHPVPTLECAVCHAINAGHASLPTTVPPNGHPFAFFNHADPAGDPTADVNSTLCVGCHGDELPTVHIGAPACICHTASYLKTEMAPLLAAGKAECVDCHKGTHAAHSFGAIGSGHNTETYGKKGVYTRFDGSQGVTLKDTEGDTLETTWTFPTANVFWSADSTQAPSTAMKGLTATSTITCQDCHTALVADGPHGAAQSWGIDPNYAYPFKYAIVGGPAGAVSATNPALNYRAGGGATAATPATLSAGIPASASGIKARIAANLGTVAVPIKSTNPADLMITNYQNYPDYHGAEYIADATSGQYAVICAKCHDLYNGSLPTTNAVDNGWSNAGPDSYEGLHGAHAGGTARNGNDLGRIDGRSDCAACHVAVPHAWRQPRLLVNGFTGNYYLGGGWSGGVLNPGTPTPSVADPYPYFQGRGMPFSTGVGLVAPTPNSPANGPNDAKDDHSANAFGKPVWEEAACISCSGDLTKTELEHKGYTTEPAKIQ
jgi:hypothetical protein